MSVRKKEAYEYQTNTLVLIEELLGEYPDDCPQSVLWLFFKGSKAIRKPEEAVRYFDLARGEALRCFKARAEEHGE
jgi:hypothetical protein